MRGILKTAAIAALTFGTTSAALATELRLSVETPPGHVRNQAAEKWEQLIEEKSGGSITVEVFPAAQLYRSADAIRALASGALDMSIQANVTLSRFEPNLSFSSLPMFFGRSAEEANEILQGPIGEEVSAMMSSKGINVPGAAFLFAPQHSSFTTDAVVSSYADLEGLKLATPPSPVSIAVMKELGALPQAAPRAEIPLMLSQGQIDGLATVTELTITGGKMWEPGVKNIFADYAGWGFYMPLVSKATMNKLTEAERSIIVEAWAETTGWAGDQAAAELANARATLTANGVTVTEASPEDIAARREALVALQDQIIADSDMDAEFIARVSTALDGN